MAVTRNTITSAVAFSGGDLANDLAEKSDLWMNNMSLIPTAIVNSGNDYQITVAPALKTGTDVVAGMNFWVTPNADNTGDVRVRIGATGTYYAVKKTDGTNLASGEFNQQTVYQLLFISGEYRMVNSPAADLLIGLLDEQIFNSSGTWTKPLNMPTTALVEVFIWGGGGGGGSRNYASAVPGGSGGGGGACTFKTFKITDLGPTVSLTVGAGGSAGNPGGNSSFGSYMTAYGGGAGVQNGAGNANSGGGGGGLTSVGGVGQVAGVGGAGGEGGGGGQDGRASTSAGGLGNGGGGGGGAGAAGSGAGGAGGSAVVGGGGGGGSGGSGGNSGGGSVFGGGGGTGSGGGSFGGVSVMGGNGAQGTTTAATTPGGGGAGGTSATYNTGASGQCRVRIIA